MADFISWGNYDQKLNPKKQVVLSGLDACIRNDEEYSQSMKEVSLCGSGRNTTTALSFASFYLDHGHYADARLIYSRVAANKPSDKLPQRNILNGKEGVAIIDMLEGNYTRAEKMCREVLKGYTDLLGADSFDRLRALHNLTEIQGGMGNYARCVENYTEKTENFAAVFGDKHYLTLREIEGLGNSCRARGLLDEAAKWMEIAKSGMEETFLDPEDPDLLGTIEGLAIVRKEQGRYDEAEALYKQALEGDIRYLGPRHPGTLNLNEEIGDVFAAKGDFKNAVAWYEIARHGRCEIIGSNHPDSTRVVAKIAELAATSLQRVNYPTFFYPWYFPVSTPKKSLKNADLDAAAMEAMQHLNIS